MDCKSTLWSTQIYAKVSTSSVLLASSSRCWVKLCVTRRSSKQYFGEVYWYHSEDSPSPCLTLWVRVPLTRSLKSSFDFRLWNTGKANSPFWKAHWGFPFVPLPYLSSIDLGPKMIKKKEHDSHFFFSNWNLYENHYTYHELLCHFRLERPAPICIWPTKGHIAKDFFSFYRVC